MKSFLYCMFIGFLTSQVAQCQVGKSKLYLGIDDFGKQAKEFLDENKNRGVKVMLGDKIYPDKPGLFEEHFVNVDTISKYILKAFPDKNTHGIGILDWEGRSFDILILFPSNSRKYQFVLKEFLKALEIAKRLRPNISWGYYGIPFKQNNFKTILDWERGNEKIAPLLRACDIFSPNLYRYTPLDLDVSFDVKEAIKLGIKYNKEVYPFIWHRYNGKENGEHMFEIMTKNDFVNDYANIILETTYNNKKVNGIIWWSFDTYFYMHKERAFLKEADNLKLFQNKYDKMIIEYVSEIIKSNN